MKKVLVVVDIQNDFVTGSVVCGDVAPLIPKIVKKVEEARKAGIPIIFTRDNHDENYLESEEGKNLPIVHAITGTYGWQIVDELQPYVADATVVDKDSWGCIELGHVLAEGQYDEVELVGLCTDVCVLANAYIAKAFLPNAHIAVDADCCMSITPTGHEHALEIMQTCHIEVRNNENGENNKFAS